MRPKLYATVSKNTTAVIHRVMKEQNCNKSEAVDFLADYYADSQKKKREKHIEETAELVIEKLKKEKIVDY